jgi:WD40 repeat protein
VATERVERPFRQFANSEAIVALSWLPNTPTALAAGTGNRWLRIYDLRDPSRVIASVGAHQKSVFGVCFDPHRDNLLATFSEESTIKLWDIRKLKDPTIQLPAGSKVAQIGWCPTRGTGILASIGKDEKNIKLWDVKSGVLGADQAEERAKPRNFKRTCLAFLIQLGINL